MRNLIPIVEIYTDKLQIRKKKKNVTLKRHILPEDKQHLATNEFVSL